MLFNAAELKAQLATTEYIFLVLSYVHKMYFVFNEILFQVANVCFTQTCGHLQRRQQKRRDLRNSLYSLGFIVEKVQLYCDLEIA